MVVRPDADETKDWVTCPRCNGTGRELTLRGLSDIRLTGNGFFAVKKSWCQLCLPNRPDFDVPPSDFSDAWHAGRGQKVGRVPIHVQVRYVLDPRPNKGLD